MFTAKNPWGAAETDPRGNLCLPPPHRRQHQGLPGWEVTTGLEGLKEDFLHFHLVPIIFSGSATTLCLC